MALSACPKGPRCDPALTRDASTRGQLLIQMYKRQMITFSADTGQPHSVGLCFAPKKSGAFRIISDAKAANCKFLG